MNSELPEGWKESELSELCIKITDGSHFSPKEVPGTPYKIATVKNISEFGIDIKTCKSISKEDYLKLVKYGCKPENDDVLISKDGTMGITFVHKDSYDRVVLLSSIAIIKPNKKKIDSYFLKYYLKWKKTQKMLVSGFSTGSALPRIVLKDLKLLPVIYPPLQEQRKIAEILGSLDDKIELNYEMNKTLEAIAQAIFKNWFVDFEPFKDELVYNEELDKEIPEGWALVSVADIADIYLGGTPKTTESSYWGGNIKWASAKDVANTPGLYIFETEKTITEKGLNNSNAKLLPADTIVITARGTVGAIRFLGESMAFNQTCYGLLPKEGISAYYLFNALTSAIRKMESLTYGTVFDTITMRTFDELKTLKPPAKIIEKFSKVIEPIYMLIKINEQESISLAQIRDTLLPKLLSGEIRVKVDVEEEFSEEAKKLEEIGKEKARIQKSKIYIGVG